MSNSSSEVTEQLPYWTAVHTTAIVAQCFSLLGSSLIITSFLMLKERRKVYNYQILFINMADLFWVFWHFTNHIDALVHGHVTTNENFCRAMGMFTHLGIGWELMWLMCVATYSAYLMYRIYHKELTSFWEPSYKVKVGTCILCWGFPIVWWLIIGLSNDAYGSIGYFCWVVSTKGKWQPWLFADGPLLISLIYIMICYSYVIYVLVVMGGARKKLTGQSYSPEIRKYAIYIIVYTLWAHPYVANSIMGVVGLKTNYPFFLYFLFMINSLGTFNFVAYGYSEQWWADLKGRMTGKPAGGKTGSSNRLSGSHQRASVSRSSGSSNQTSSPEPMPITTTFTTISVNEDVPETNEIRLGSATANK